MGFGFLLSLEVKRHNGVAILAALKDFSEDLLAFLFIVFFSSLACNGKEKERTWKFEKPIFHLHEFYGFCI